MNAPAGRLRELALELRTIAAGKLGNEDARSARQAADELVGIAGALEQGGAIVDGYVAVPLPETHVRGVPIPPPAIGGKHHRPARERVQ
jgi:hypothetical protein